MSLSCINMSVLGSFNEFLKECDLPFILICVGMDEQWLIDLKKFTALADECVDAVGVPEVPYGLVAIDRDTKEIAAYISFSISSQGRGPGKLCEEYNPLRAIALECSCTGNEYRKRGLFKLLSLVIISYAIQEKYEEVVASTNKTSAHILSTYFGFELADGVELMRENCAFHFNLDINARLVLHESSLQVYHHTRQSMVDCKLVKN